MVKLNKVKWCFDDMNFNLDGLSDGSRWNGWGNVWIDEETMLQAIDWLAMVGYDGNFEDALDEMEGYLEPNNDGLYCWGFGLCIQIIK